MDSLSATLTAETLESIDAVEPAVWDTLDGAEPPFLCHAFLATLEQTGCVGPATGWQPQHLLLRERGRICAAMPLYLKNHSWGEFVFDWAWAAAYRRLGLAYYPKLVVTVPFTPATGARMLLAANVDRARMRSALLQAARQQLARTQASSLHVLFPHPDELETCRAAGFALRKDCQFQWYNAGYASFDDFLATFTSAKRKKVRRERRRVAEAGIRITMRPGETLGAREWERIYALYESTYDKRGMIPYLTERFFPTLAARLPGALVVLGAELDGEMIAMALFLRSRTTLYGRYWGCFDEQHSLHFEACYYRGIDYCIAHRLQRFEPGTQGEHKLVRGFVPTVTWSAHWLADARLRSAVEAYLAAEGSEIDRYVEAAGRHLPFRADAVPDSGPGRPER